MDRRTQDRATYKGFGFTVRIVGKVPMMKVRGRWYHDIPPPELERLVAWALVSVPWRLTGHQIHFLRSFFDLRLAAFGKRFGDVTHVSVIQWQQFREKPTTMNWGTEKDIRLAVVAKIRPERLAETYAELATIPTAEPQALVVSFGVD